jgi:hypothetical protein
MHHQENIKNAQYSKVGRVNLGARIASKASRKCQDLLCASTTFRTKNFVLNVVEGWLQKSRYIIRLPRIYRERMRLPKQVEKAS